MSRIILTLTLLIVFNSLPFALFAQSDTLYYFFDKNGKSCQSKNAAYVGFGIREDGVIRFTNYTVSEGLPVVEGHFTDSTLTVKNGYFKSFNPPGYIDEEGAYKKDSKEGYWLRWNKNGQVEDSEFYQHGNLLLSIQLSYNHFGSRISRIANNNVQGKRDLTEWYVNGNVKVAASWIQDDGDSYHYDEDGKLIGIDTYEKGKVTQSKYYKKDGSLMTDQETAALKKEELEKANRRVKEIQEEAFRTPSFPGGQDAFWVYLQEHIRVPPSVFDHLPNRTVKLSFMLNGVGSAEDIKIIDNGSSDIRRTVVDMLSKMPRWDMKGYKSYGPLLYTFTIQGSLSQF